MLAPTELESQKQAESYHHVVNSSTGNTALLQSLRTQVEYYFSEQNLPRDGYLNTVMANNNGRVPTALIATFPKIQRLYQSYSANIDCCTLLTNAMLSSHIVGVEDSFLYPIRNFASSSLTPKRINATENHLKIHKNSLQTTAIATFASTMSAASSTSTNEEIEWIGKEHNDGSLKTNNDNCNTVTTCSPTSFSSETVPAAPSSLDDQDNCHDKYSKAKTYDDELNSSFNDLAVTSSNRHMPTSISSSSRREQVEVHPQHHIPTSPHHEVPKAGHTGISPVMATYSSELYYPHYYYPPQYLYPTYNGSVSAPNPPQVARALLPDPYYYYNMHQTYQYQYHLPLYPGYQYQPPTSQQQYQEQESFQQKTQLGTSSSLTQNDKNNNNAMKEGIPPHVVFVPPTPSPASAETINSDPKSLSQQEVSERKQLREKSSAGSRRGNRKSNTNSRSNRGKHEVQLSKNSKSSENFKKSSQASLSNSTSSGKTGDNVSQARTNQKKKKQKHNVNTSNNHRRQSKQSNHVQGKEQEKQILSEENFPALVPSSLSSSKVENYTSFDRNEQSKTINFGAMPIIANEQTSPMKKTGYAEALLKQYVKSKCTKKEQQVPPPTNNLEVDELSNDISKVEARTS